MFQDLGLLILRVSFGLLLPLQHGFGKLALYPEKLAEFPDPLSMGTSASWFLTFFGEAITPLAVALGLFTRLAALPTVFLFFVVVFVVLKQATFKELEVALLYLTAFTTIACTGPGRFSLDTLLFRKKS